MPLNRDQHHLNKLSQPDTNLLATNRTDEASQKTSRDNSDTQGPLRNTNNVKNENQSSDSMNQRRDFKNMFSAQNIQQMKLPLPNTTMDRNRDNRLLPSTFSHDSTSKQSHTGNVRVPWKPKKSSHIPSNVFDDTESIDQSELDREDTEEVTAVLRSNILAQNHQQGLYKTSHTVILPRTQTSIPTIENSSQWLQTDLRDLNSDEDLEEQVRNVKSDFTVATQDFIGRDDNDDLDNEMDTPSRPQAIPRSFPIHGIKKKVEFVSNTEIFGGSTSSPFTKSVELARELSPTLQPPQPTRTQSMMYDMSTHDHDQQEMAQYSRSNDLSTTQGPTPTRFAKVHAHKSRVVEQSNKVSAPDSDVQESSDDERAEVLTGERHDTDFSVPTVRKRRNEWDHESCYTLEEMRGKKLSDLQGEPFLKSPKVQLKHLATTEQHEAPLAVQLLKLQDYTEDDQRKVFRAQNDEDWMQTGQWFMDKFQEDLEKLMSIRLERRKIALRYEDRLRRHQKEVEWAQSGVEKELRELQSGGGELIRNRKVPSRASTPMKIPPG